MWYSTPSEDQHEPVRPDEVVEPDLQTTPESGEANLAAKVLACSKVDAASAGPGSEYWLP